MSYRVVVMVPSGDCPGMNDVCFCELRYSVKRRFIWFGRRFIDVSLALGSLETIKPLERKEDADLTAQVVYLAMRSLGAEVVELVCAERDVIYARVRA